MYMKSPSAEILLPLIIQLAKYMNNCGLNVSLLMLGSTFSIRKFPFLWQFHWPGFWGRCCRLQKGCACSIRELGVYPVASGLLLTTTLVLHSSGSGQVAATHMLESKPILWSPVLLTIVTPALQIGCWSHQILCCKCKGGAMKGQAPLSHFCTPLPPPQPSPAARWASPEIPWQTDSSMPALATAHQLSTAWFL